MTTKIISFLGTVVRPTMYSYQGAIYEGGVFQIALRQFIEFDEMLVFVTPDAYQKAYPALAALGDERIKPVDIRTGRTSEGLWQIFNTLVTHVDEGDTVIFDITHGLRSIPFLTFLAAAYLRSAKTVLIQSVLYGALELGSPAPVIDLTEFVSLLDWLTATNQFIKTGNATDLAQVLGRTEHLAAQDLAKTVEGIATGLHLLRPFETTREAAQLSERLNKVKPELSLPFAVLSDNLLTSYGRFGEVGKTDARDQLTYQLEMTHWYHERGQVVHALSLGREWLVSLLCVQFDLAVAEKRHRDEMELLLRGGVDKDPETKQIIRQSSYMNHWGTILSKKGKRLRDLWGGAYNLANLRNDVLHSGFRHNPKDSAEVKQETDAVLNRLYEIAAEDWGFLGLRRPRIEEAPH